MKSSTGRTRAATRSLRAIQMPSGMPSTRLITADAVISASVLMVAGQNPVAMMTKNEAAQNSPNFQPTRHRPMADIAPATAQSGNATRTASIASVKAPITLPRFTRVPLSWASTKFRNWLTHWPSGNASCIAGLLIAQVLEQNGLGHRSEEHTSELQSQSNLVCRLLLEKKKTKTPALPTTHTKKNQHHPPTP